MIVDPGGLGAGEWYLENHRRARQMVAGAGQGPRERRASYPDGEPRSKGDELVVGATLLAH